MNQKRIVNKIEAIKTLRQYCTDTWGQPVGLLLSKQLIEDIMSQQTVTLTSEQVNRILVIAANREYNEMPVTRTEAISNIINEVTY